MIKPKLELLAGALLGEGPRWCAREQALYWVDILRPALHRYSPRDGSKRRWALPESIGCAASLGGGLWLLALRSGLHAIDTVTGALERLNTVEHATPQHRFNDGAVDPQGRFWVGSMSESGGQTGGLYRYDSPRGEWISHGWSVPNGIGWSPDGSIMYATDSRLRVIWAYDYALDSGVPGNRRVFATFEHGVPDGLAVDAEGCVWSAIWDGWRVVRLDPQGREISRVEMPVQRPTSVAFGGSSLRTLYVTSASVNLQRPEGGDWLAGALFSVETTVPGLPSRDARLRLAGVPV